MARGWLGRFLASLTDREVRREVARGHAGLAGIHPLLAPLELGDERLELLALLVTPAADDADGRESRRRSAFRQSCTRRERSAKEANTGPSVTSRADARDRRVAGSTRGVAVGSGMAEVDTRGAAWRMRRCAGRSRISRLHRVERSTRRRLRRSMPSKEHGQFACAKSRRSRVRA
jgi:hypothetical protein